MNRTTKVLVGTLITFSFFIAEYSNAGKYYRWKDETGTTNYGTQPPAGVKAEEIRTYGSGSADTQNSETSYGSANNAEKESAERKAIKEKHEKQCHDERERLKTLRSNSMIKMTQDDGTARYLNADEISEEVKRSETFLEQSCK